MAGESKMKTNATTLIAGLIFVSCAGSFSSNNECGELSYPYCKKTETHFAPEDMTPLGFRGQDLIDMAKSIHTKLQWEDGESTNLSIVTQFEVQPDVVFSTSVPV